MAGEGFVWIEGEWLMEAEELAAPTSVLCIPRAEETRPEASPSEKKEPEAEEETKPEPSKRGTSKERRHLAGANWLDDWTLFFPAQKLPGSRPKK